MTEEKQELQTAEKEEAKLAEGVERVSPRKTFIPRVDIYETEEELVLLADMPGVAINDVEITLEKNELKLQGHVQIPAPENMQLAYAEYEVGDYERTFTVSDEIDREKINATMKDGVLYLRLPKAAPAKTRKIEVKSA